MQLRADRLTDELDRDLLRGAYLICGDEPLQVSECVDAVRAAARRLGIDERVVMHVEAGFDWHGFGAESGAMSLFSSRRLLELRIPSGKPGTEGAKALAAWAADSGGEDVLLVVCPRLDKRAQQAKWAQALAGRGALVSCYDIEPARLPGWLMARAGGIGLDLAEDAAALIAERSEGNMLAAAQELDKLRLLVGTATVDADTARSVIADSARHDVFELADAALAGESPRALRILRGLRAEGVEAQRVSWLLGREIGLLVGVMGAMAAGASEATALRDQRVWDKRVPLVKGAIRRHRRHGLLRLARLAARLERTGKGMTGGDPWQECTWLTMALAGHRLPGIEKALLG